MEPATHETATGQGHTTSMLKHRIYVHTGMCVHMSTQMYVHFFKIINKLLAYIETWKIEPERGKGKGIKTKQSYRSDNF